MDQGYEPERSDEGLILVNDDSSFLRLTGQTLDGGAEQATVPVAFPRSPRSQALRSGWAIRGSR